MSLEATDRQGKILDRVELGNVYHTGITMKDQFPLIGSENGVSSGMLRILGNVHAVASTTCDGELLRGRYAHPLPQPGGGSGSLPKDWYYKVISFTTKHLGFDEWWSTHEYAYHLTIKNPTEKDFTYVVGFLFRDKDGFVVARATTKGHWSTSPLYLKVPAGLTRTLEDTFHGSFSPDPKEITVEVEILGVRGR